MGELQERAQRFVESLQDLQEKHGFYIGNGGDGGEIGIADEPDGYYRFELECEAGKPLASPRRFCESVDSREYDAEHYHPAWPSLPEEWCVRCGQQNYTSRNLPTP